jgi:FkbM family methyltransferase
MESAEMYPMLTQEKYEVLDPILGTKLKGMMSATGIQQDTTIDKVRYDRNASGSEFKGVKAKAKPAKIQKTKSQKSTTLKTKTKKPKKQSLSKKTKEVYPYVNMNSYCLGNLDDNIDIYIPQWSVGLSSIINRPVFSQLNQEIVKLNVKCEKLDTYCELNNISEIGFIKIDVEGAEKIILEGAEKMLRNNKIKCGIFEVGQTLTDANTSEQDIINLLEGYGYKIDKTISQNDYLFYLP